MANFATHIGAGTVVAGALATLTLAADVVAPENLVAVTMAGVLGPSAGYRFAGFASEQADVCRPCRVLLFCRAVQRRHQVFDCGDVDPVAGHARARALWPARRSSTACPCIAASGIRSWRALFSSVATAVVYYHVLGRHEGVAWLAAGFMMIGYLTHLILDEMYSVDVMDTRIKASFGTALKIDRYAASGGIGGHGRRDRAGGLCCAAHADVHAWHVVQEHVERLAAAHVAGGKMVRRHRYAARPPRRQAPDRPARGTGNGDTTGRSGRQPPSDLMLARKRTAGRRLL